MIELIFRIIVDIIAIGILVFAFIPDYHPKAIDGRTNKFKSLKKYLFFLIICTLLGSIGLTINDYYEKNKSEKEKKDELEKIESYYTKQLRISNETNYTTLETLKGTDSIIARTKELNKQLTKNFINLSKQAQQLKFPIKDEFYANFEIHFQLDQLANVIDTNLDDVHEKLYGKVIHGGSESFSFNFPHSTFHKNIADSILFIFNSIELNLRFYENSDDTRFNLKIARFPLFSPLRPSANFSDLNKPILQFESFCFYVLRNREFYIQVKNLPLRLINTKGIRSLKEIMQLNLEIHLRFHRDYNYVPNKRLPPITDFKIRQLSLRHETDRILTSFHFEKKIIEEDDHSYIFIPNKIRYNEL